MKVHFKLFLCAALGGTAFGLAAPAAYAEDMPAMMSHGMLTDAHGMTLYTFDKDSGGKSACNGKCAENWPPLAVPAGAMAGGDYSVITRDDGGKQWAYKGKPLYHWAGDKKAGDKAGDGKGGLWHVISQ